MLELLKYFGLPSVSASTQGPAIDNIISIVHWLMLILFIGWGVFINRPKISLPNVPEFSALSVIFFFNQYDQTSWY